MFYSAAARHQQNSITLVVSPLQCPRLKARHSELFVSLSAVCISLNQARERLNDPTDEQITESLLQTLVRLYQLPSDLARFKGRPFFFQRIPKVKCFSSTMQLYTSHNWSIMPFALFRVLFSPSSLALLNCSTS